MKTGINKCNLLLVTNSLHVGGVEEVVRTYVKYFDKQRYNIAIICFEAGTIAAEIAAIPGVRLLHIGTKSRLKRFRAIFAYARSFKPTIVHNHTGWYGLLVGRLVGAKTVETVHNVYHWYTLAQRIHYGLYANLADRIIAVSGVVRDFTLNFFPFFPGKKIQVLHNGIEVPPLPSAETRRDQRMAFGFNDSTMVLGFTGRLTEQKGIEYLLESVKILTDRFPGVRLLIIGDGERKTELESLAERLNICDQVVFTGYRRDIFALIGAMDIFVLPSLWEGLPISLLEAMAMHLPAVASDVGGIREVIDDGINGFLVPARDVKTLVARLTTVLEDHEQRRTMGAAARKRVQESFSADGMVRATDALYQSLLNG